MDFKNNLLLNAWITPPSFSNTQGATLADNSQRRFAPQFNNPDGLLDFNRNRIKDNNLVVSIQNETWVGNDLRMESKLNFTRQDQLQQFGVTQGTAGFDQGFLSDKQIINTQLNTNSALIYRKFPNSGKHELNLKSNIDYKYDHVDFHSLQLLA